MMYFEREAWLSLLLLLVFFIFEIFMMVLF